MAVRTSTGFEALILGARSFDSIFQDGCIEVRTGLQPATADDAPTGVLVARITRDGAAWTPGVGAGGLRFQRAGRFVTNNPAQQWVLKGLATGAAGWFRLLPNAADPQAYSLEAPRIDGAVGVMPDEGIPVGDVQLFLPTQAMTASTTIPINYWWLAKPPLPGA